MDEPKAVTIPARQAGAVSSRALRFPEQPVRAEPPVFAPTQDGGVECTESNMELHRPYPFRVGDWWFVAVRRSTSEGDVSIYDLEG
jgi:hypothetical protein